LINNRKENFKALLGKPEISMLIVLVFLAIGLSFASPYFLTARNVVNILRQFSLIAILAVGEGLVILTAEIDLSVGSLVGLTACFGAFVGKMGANPIVTLIAILGIGAVAGFVNGFLVAKAGIPSFIVTLGMMSIGAGFSLLLTMGTPIHYNPTWISKLGGGYIGIFPI